MTMKKTCERCNEELGFDLVIDSQGDKYCRRCVDKLIEDGVFKSVSDFKGFDD